MGASFVNFHVRSEDRAAIAKALARISPVQALVASPRHGWTSFVDVSASSQDTQQLSRIARSLSKKVSTAVFAFLVHDSDVFHYQLFDRGRLVDRYQSLPERSHPASKAMRQKYAGRPESLLPWVRPGVTVEDLRTVLAGTAAYRFEEERAAAFAALFAIDAGLAGADFQDFDESDAEMLSVLSKSNPAARALQQAVRAQDIAAVRAALAQGASPNLAMDDGGGMPLLYTAMSPSNLELVKVLCEAGAKCEARRADGRIVDTHLALAVGCAAHSGRTEILDYLLTELAPPTALALADGLRDAVQCGSMELVQRLLRAGADVNSTGGVGALPLAHAVGRGHRVNSPRRAPTDWPQIVQALLDAGANVNGRQDDGMTPLMAAAAHHEPGFVRQLLALGADPDARLDSGVNALLLARAYGHRDIVDTLRPVTAVDPDPSPGSLWAAAAAGDLAEVESALAAGVSPNVVDSHEHVPLLFAARNNHYEVALRLLEAGADPNFSTKYNDLTALWFARLHGDGPLVELLVQATARGRKKRPAARR